jgi:hypothetical protein
VVSVVPEYTKALPEGTPEHFFPVVVGSCFCWGFWQKRVVGRGVLGGEVVVDSGKLMVRIWARKTCHFFRIYFEGFPFWEFWGFGSASSPAVARASST